MYMLTAFLLSFFLVVQSVATEDGWMLFARVAFKTKYFKEYNENFLVPSFDAAIRQREGTVVQLTGYYMPIELPERTIILSRYPYASCFFCGGAGPESVAEVSLSSKPGKFRVDQIVTIKGKLKLNDTDVNHMNFILEDAEIVNE
jgi:hypothetical protein